MSDFQPGSAVRFVRIRERGRAAHFKVLEGKVVEIADGVATVKSGRTHYQVKVERLRWADVTMLLTETVMSWAGGAP